MKHPIYCYTDYTEDRDTGSFWRQLCLIEQTNTQTNKEEHIFGESHIHPAGWLPSLLFSKEIISALKSLNANADLSLSTVMSVNPSTDITL